MYHDNVTTAFINLCVFLGWCTGEKMVPTRVIERTVPQPS